MKKRVFALLLSALILLLCACGGKPSASANTYKIIEVGERTLLVTGSEGDFDLSSVSTEGARITDEKGREITHSDLRPGMILELGGCSAPYETYPRQFDVKSVRVLKQGDDLVGLYRRVLWELWENDPALNENITTIGIDFSGLSNLSEVERNALKYTLECDVWVKTGQFVDVVTGTWQELCDEGYIDDENLYWEDGVYLSIVVTNPGEREFTFEAQKWRSGTGAIWFKGCTAKQGKAGQWNYELGGFAIA